MSDLDKKKQKLRGGVVPLSYEIELTLNFEKYSFGGREIIYVNVRTFISFLFNFLFFNQKL